MSGGPDSPMRQALMAAMAKRQGAPQSPDQGGGENEAGGPSPQDVLECIQLTVTLLTGIAQKMQSDPQSAAQIVALASGGQVGAPPAPQAPAGQ